MGRWAEVERRANRERASLPLTDEPRREPAAFEGRYASLKPLERARGAPSLEGAFFILTQHNLLTMNTAICILWCHSIGRAKRDTRGVAMEGTREAVYGALKAQGLEVLYGKDGGFYVRGEGFVSLPQARKRTGIVAPKRAARQRVACGDYAFLCAMNRPAKK